MSFVPPGQFLIFLAGGFFAVGVNLFSTLALRGTDVPLAWIVIVALLWLATGAFTAWLGEIVADADKHVAATATKTFSAQARKDLRNAVLSENRQRLKIAAIFSLLTFASACLGAIAAYKSEVPGPQIEPTTSENGCVDEKTSSTQVQ
jgi:hypothetical protein